MRVLLISCYELGHQPLGLASPAAHLRAAGLPVECLDLAVEPFDEERVRSADLVAISVPMHTAVRLGVQAARRVRAVNPRCHVSFYGLYASLNQEHLLRTVADSIVGGEYEQPLTALVRALAAGDGAAVDGVSTGSGRALPFLGRQDFLVPDRRGLPPLERYARLEIGDERRLAGAVDASRGCAHRCRHCPITPVYEGRLRIVPAEVVLADVAQLVALGAEHLTFGDPDFLNGVRHSMSVAREVHAAFPALTFDVTAKIEHLVHWRALLPELRALGCVLIVSAVESLNDTVLRILEKGHTRADVAQALALTRGAGIALRPSFVSFTPWTSLEDYLDVLEFVEEHDLVDGVDPVQYAIRLLVPPGSSLLAAPELRPYLGGLDEEAFSWEWTHPDGRMPALHAEVSRAVEAAAAAHEDPFVTFHRVKHLALATLAGRPLPPARRHEPHPRPPRLTESWFC